MKEALRVERLEGPHALHALAAECDRIAARMTPRLPFATSDWLSLWWQHYREQRFLVRDRFFVHTVRDERGVLLALAPLMLTERPGSGPFRSRGITFFGGDKNVTELRGLVCAPEHEGPAIRALLAHLCTRGEDWDWLVWNGVRQGAEGQAALEAAGSFEWLRETTDYVLFLPPTWEAFRGSRSRNIKESLRKCYNSLKRDGHSFEFRVASQAGDLPAALNRFYELHSRRAKADDLVRHEDVFAIPRARELVSALARRPSTALAVHAFELSIAGKVVASRLGFLMGDELYLYFSGYDPAWGNYSVMTTTVAETIKWAIERQVRLVNLSPGTDVSKTRWGASTVTTESGVLISPTRRGRAVFGVVGGLNRHSRPGTLLGKMFARARRKG